MVALVYAGLEAVHKLPHWLNPFGETTKDRSAPVVLNSIQNLSRYEAATGNYQVVVDLEKDAKFLPSQLRGERTLFVGNGNVDAYVDFSAHRQRRPHGRQGAQHGDGAHAPRAAGEDQPRPETQLCVRAPSAGCSTASATSSARTPTSSSSSTPGVAENPGRGELQRAHSACRREHEVDAHEHVEGFGLQNSYRDFCHISLNLGKDHRGNTSLRGVVGDESG